MAIVQKARDALLGHVAHNNIIMIQADYSNYHTAHRNGLLICAM